MNLMLQTAKIFNTLFDDLTPRQREVLVARFGLDGKEPKTLEAIGAGYGVTRERVRQIEAAALSVVRSAVADNAECAQVFEKDQKFLKSVGGVSRVEDLLAQQKTFIDGLTENHLAVLIEAAHPFFFYREDEQFRSFYYLSKDALKAAQDAIAKFVKSLTERKDGVLAEGYSAHLASFVKKQKFDQKLFDNYLAITKKIQTNPYGDTGLADWEVIDPRTIRDRIYLVLKKEGRPVHFRDIASLINQAGFVGRKALAPTVHNELIKDKRFVLVGRGIYALSEHGYEPGIAREVIYKILKTTGPLKFPQIVDAVQKERFFKPNTVLANLQNKKMFRRLDDGSYHVSQA